MPEASGSDLADESDYSIFENKTGLAEDMKFLASMPELCDVTFLVGDTREPICAVKAVLAARSRVFQKMFYQAPSPQRKKEPPPRENKLRVFLKRSSEPLLNLQNAAQQRSGFAQQLAPIQEPNQHHTVIIEEFEPDVFRQLIEYIHTGSVTLQPRTLLGLMNAADYYGLDQLRKACTGFVHCCITVDTVCALLASAERYIQYKCTKSLVQKVLEFVDEHGNEVLNLGSFTLLPQHVVRLILAREELRADEFTKFQAALMWSKKYCDSNQNQSLKDVIGNFLEYIQFHKIPANVLMKEVHPLGLIPSGIIVNALAYQADPTSVDPGKLSPHRVKHHDRSLSVQSSLQDPCGSNTSLSSTGSDEGSDEKQHSGKYGTAEQETRGEEQQWQQKQRDEEDDLQRLIEQRSQFQQMRQEEEVQRQQEEQQIRRQEEELRKQEMQEEFDKRQKKKKQQEEESKRQQQEDEELKKRQQDEELRKKQQEEELKGKQEEEELRKKQQEEDLQKKQQEEELKKKQQEENLQKKQQEEELNKKQQEEELKRKEQEEDMQKKKQEEELKRKQQEEELKKKKQEEDTQKKQQEEELKKKQLDEKFKREEKELKRQRIEDELQRQEEEDIKRQKQEKESKQQLQKDEAVEQQQAIEEQEALAKQQDREWKEQQEEVVMKDEQYEALSKEQEESIKAQQQEEQRQEAVSEDKDKPEIVQEGLAIQNLEDLTKQEEGIELQEEQNLPSREQDEEQRRIRKQRKMQLQLDELKTRWTQQQELMMQKQEEVLQREIRERRYEEQMEGQQFQQLQLHFEGRKPVPEERSEQSQTVERRKRKRRREDRVEIRVKETEVHKQEQQLEGQQSAEGVAGLYIKLVVRREGRPNLVWLFKTHKF